MLLRQSKSGDCPCHEHVTAAAIERMRIPLSRRRYGGERKEARVTETFRQLSRRGDSVGDYTTTIEKKRQRRRHVIAAILQRRQ